MEMQATIKPAGHEISKVLEKTSWILFSLAAITFALIHLNVLDGITLLAISVRGNPVTFGYPTLLFLLGAFTCIWSIYIGKSTEQRPDVQSFFRALGLTVSTGLAALGVVVLITLIESL